MTYVSVCLYHNFHKDCGDEEMHSKAVRQYEAGLESSYKEQCALALEDKKTVLRRIINEKENGERVTRGIINRLRPIYFTCLLTICIFDLCTVIW